MFACSMSFSIISCCVIDHIAFSTLIKYIAPLGALSKYPPWVYAVIVSQESSLGVALRHVAINFNRVIIETRLLYD